MNVKTGFKLKNKNDSIGVNLMDRILNLVNLVDFAVWDIKLLYWFSEFDR
jgi:hypothetical protein